MPDYLVIRMSSLTTKMHITFDVSADLNGSYCLGKICVQLLLDSEHIKHIFEKKYMGHAVR